MNLDVDGSCCNDLNRDQAGQLRDWLVYHFPKENA